MRSPCRIASSTSRRVMPRSIIRASTCFRHSTLPASSAWTRSASVHTSTAPAHRAAHQSRDAADRPGTGRDTDHLRDVTQMIAPRRADATGSLRERFRRGPCLSWRPAGGISAPCNGPDAPGSAARPGEHPAPTGSHASGAGEPAWAAQAPDLGINSHRPPPPMPPARAAWRAGRGPGTAASRCRRGRPR